MTYKVDRSSRSCRHLIFLLGLFCFIPDRNRFMVKDTNIFSLQTRMSFLSAPTARFDGPDARFDGWMLHFDGRMLISVQRPDAPFDGRMVIPDALSVRRF